MEYKLTIKYNQNIYNIELRGYIARTNAQRTLPYTNYPNILDSIDWRNKSKVTGIKYQNMCGSDWAFAATAYA